MKRVTNPDTGKFRHFEMSEDEYRALVDNYEGICTACSEVRGCCEPDARKYECTDGCREMRVYGAEELMLMGRIKLSERGEEVQP